MPGDTVIDCTGGAGGFAVGVLLNGCHLICTERDFKQCNAIKQELCHLDSLKYWKVLCSPLVIPEVFMKRSKQDMVDMNSRKKNSSGQVTTEKDVRWFPSTDLLCLQSPEATGRGTVRDWIPPRYRTQELVTFSRELQRAWEKAKPLRVRSLRSI